MPLETTDRLHRPASVAPDAAMQPVTIRGTFGWLHSPVSRAPANTAVLLCPGLRDDGLTAHGQFRRLAQTLAEAGYATLRFDYPATGNSCDEDASRTLWAAWKDSVDAAAEWLLANTGAHQLVLCGLRLGALLAAEAAATRADVVGLALLAPTPRGRTFIRQWEIEAKLARTQAHDALRFHGRAVSAADLQDIAAAELQRAVPPPGCATIMLNPAPSTVLEQCARAWQQQGVRVEQAGFDGLAPLLRSRVLAHEPPADFSAVLAWLRRVAQDDPAGHAATLPAGVLVHAEWRDTPLRFGAGGRLFGMLCQPADGPGGQVVVIVNSGGDPHYGADRCGTNMARQLAAAGIASLRMDFAGIGDSLAPSDGQTHLFETDRRPEVSAAFDALEALGYHRLGLCGVCSGAYHGFHAAAADARVATLLLVNLPTFEWQVGTEIESFQLYDAGLGERARHAWSAGLWRRLLKGELGIQRRAWARLRRLVRPAEPAGAGPSRPRAALLDMARRTRTLMLMSPHELGLVAIKEAFGPSGKMPGVTLRVLPSIDHTVTDPAMRAQVTAMMIAFLAAVQQGA